MKKYRVSKELKKICAPSIDPKFFTNIILLQMMFHQIVQRAKCEKATEETGVFMVTAKERNNVKMLSSLLKQNGVTSYQVIDDADASRRLIK